jgi:hypothetical protein
MQQGRNQHQALDALYVAIKRKTVNWVTDVLTFEFLDPNNPGSRPPSFEWENKPYR